MAIDRGIRTYLVLEAPEEFVRLYARGRTDEVLPYLLDRSLRDRPPVDGDAIRVLALPSLPSLGDALKDAPATVRAEREGAIPDRLVVSLLVDRRTLDWLRERAAGEGPKEGLLGAGLDLPIHAARHWCPGYGGGGFADRGAAERLIKAQALRDGGRLGRAAGLTGQAVNVAVVDSGLDATRLNNFGGGWASGGRVPGGADGGHGMAMARQILSLAPEARLFDYAVLPPRITSLPTFLSDVLAAYAHLNAVVAYRRQAGDRSPWVVLNAWSVFERRWNPGGLDDPFIPFNALVDALVGRGADIVFAAGNCGQFDPDPRCGRADRGPGVSILGANAHPLVLTVGAVRADGLWLGSSSQGPGPGPAHLQKPDLCAPSAFRETQDGAILNTGTSAACAVAAAAIAALRQRWPDLAPAQMKQALIDSARKTQGAVWSPRLGHGILDVEAALGTLLAQHP